MGALVMQNVALGKGSAKIAWLTRLRHRERPEPLRQSSSGTSAALDCFRFARNDEVGCGSQPVTHSTFGSLKSTTSASSRTFG